MSKYPKLKVDLKKLDSNINKLKEMCAKQNISIAGVIKGFNGLPDIALTFDKNNLPFIASSRIGELKPLKDKVKAELMLIRTPMLSEISDVIKFTDISLNSEIEVLKALNEEAKKENKIHKVILMKDLGDLREGFWSDEEILNAALLIENSLSNLFLLGIGTNLGCYGSITPTPEKLNELVSCANMIEEKIGRKLDIISGGATSSLPRVIDNDMPKRINNLRIGEGILLGNVWGHDMNFLYKDVFKLEAEVIEVKQKPTYPVGEIFVDAFGNKPTYEDRGIKKRAIVALGKADYAFFDRLILKEEGAFLVGSSSDHTIIDIENTKRDIKVGDIIEFDLCYATLIYLTSKDDINIEIIK